ncbi:alpha/beta fold hydrolase [Luteolibacter algae]|uniref:Alpha/beta fold hydrolase n=1 Tax=Luteolibacter algae TaxID=454151 RepID=A0ABW5D209_9BACT
MSIEHMKLDFLKNPPPVAEPNFWEYTPGFRLAWNEYGDPSGKPVFYYHGWPSSRLQARLAHHLAREKGLRIISMDRPGMGKSSLVRDRRLKDWPELMAKFADHLEIEKFGQLAISGGGPYALSCAAAIPEKLSGTSVLAGMVPIPLTDGGRDGLHPLYRMMIPLRKSPAPLFTGLFRAVSLTCKLQPDRYPMSLFLQSLAREDREIMLHGQEIWSVITKSFTEGVCGPSGGRGIITDAEIYLTDPCISPEDIVHPIHYWHGGDDKNIPVAYIHGLAARMPAAELTIVPELGHFSLAVHRADAALDHLAECSV